MSNSAGLERMMLQVKIQTFADGVKAVDKKFLENIDNFQLASIQTDLKNLTNRVDKEIEKRQKTKGD